MILLHAFLFFSVSVLVSFQFDCLQTYQPKMQKKINSFFKSTSAPKSPNLNPISENIVEDNWLNKQSDNDIKYTREASSQCRFTSGRTGGLNCEKDVDRPFLEDEKLKLVVSSEKVLNRKRSYAQFHLKLGQSDFLLHTCSTCGIKYAKGDNEDEKLHGTFHRNYTHGVQFKGWRHERLIDMTLAGGDRIILVLNTDPPARRNKIHEVVKMMEIELGDGWMFHEECKVYFFVSSQRIAGCLVAEPISKAYKILSSSSDKSSGSTSLKEGISKPINLQFGEVCFRREVSKRLPSSRSSAALHMNLPGAIFCEEEAVPAVCGIRAIWVSPSNRRKGIATYLLEALRYVKALLIFALLSRLPYSYSSGLEPSSLILKYMPKVFAHEHEFKFSSETRISSRNCCAVLALSFPVES
ncbi:hypothetical protein Dimus_023492 [Dionaea muscipula]